MVNSVFLSVFSLAVSSQASFVQKSAATSSAENDMTYVGDFQGFWYNVGGQVHLLDDHTIFIIGFSYTGGGPAAYFWVGTQGSPGHNNESTTAFLAYPFHGQHFRYHDYPGPSIPRMENMNITLTLPPHITTSMVRWLSVWCKPFRANFGQIIFPPVVIKDMNTSTADSIEHQVSSEEQGDNMTKIKMDVSLEETKKIISKENVSEPSAVTEAAYKKVEEMKERQGKSFSNQVFSSDKEHIDITENDTKEELNVKDIKVKDSKMEPNDKDVEDNDTKIEAFDDLVVDENRTGHDKKESDSSCITILPSMFLFIFVVFII